MIPKQSLSDLAIFGGTPSFPKILHVGRPNIPCRKKLIERMEDMLDRGWLTNNGPCVQEFEGNLSRYLSVEHCIAICNATVALQIVVRALNLSGEVIIPSFTFIATAHALEWQGIRPIFCDIDPRTHNIDSSRVEELITPRTTGILGVHLWGRPCNIEALEEVARRRNLHLLFDAAHALGCSHKGRMIGAFGAAEIFSFHATKFFNTFEGGLIATNDGVLAENLRLMRNFGFAGYDNVIQAGTNGKMSEPCAVMGLTSLESVDEFVSINRRNYEAYRRGLADLPGLSLITYDDGEKCNRQYVIVEVDKDRAGIARDHLVRLLQAENIFVRRYFFPGCHRMEPYRSRDPRASDRLPITERIAARVMAFPTGTAISPEQIERICDLIRFILAHTDDLRGFGEEQTG